MFFSQMKIKKQLCDVMNRSKQRDQETLFANVLLFLILLGGYGKQAALTGDTASTSKELEDYQKRIGTANPRQKFAQSNNGRGEERVSISPIHINRTE